MDSHVIAAAWLHNSAAQKSARRLATRFRRHFLAGLMPAKTLTLLSLAAALSHAQTVLVKPYVQPGDGATLVGHDVKTLVWLTDAKPGTFTVEYAVKGGPALSATPVSTPLDFAKATPKPTTPQPAKPAEPPKLASPLADAATTLDELKTKIAETFAPIVEREQHYLRYQALLPNLPFDATVGYSVKLGAAVVREGIFKTRASAAMPAHFVIVGDLASNKPEQKSVAYQISLTKPDFLVALGDIVYPGGRALQYMNHFFPVYNDVATPSAKDGAPIMASVPIYPVIGNHDADSQKFPDFPDAYSAFYFFSVPKNGPGEGAWNLPLGKDAKLAAAFRAAAGSEYPAMSDYSFDSGPAHFLVLDANSYTTAALEKLAPWIERDLAASKQPWKIVCFHQPAFHTSREHYTEQKMRLLEPIFEKHGVDVVFAGHVHNYQRSKPLKFTPNPPKRDARGRVNGDFVLDQTFNGTTDTTPEGIIHIVTGGGGAKLYSVDLAKTIAALKKDHGGNYQPITDKYVADKNSFSVVDVTPTTFDLRQITLEGKEVDRFRITKPAN